MKTPTLQHRLYLIGVALKSFDGLIELISSALLLLTTNANLKKLANSIANNELVEEPNNHLAAHFQQVADHFSKGSQHFAALYLAAHGLIKIILVVGLWRQWRDCFPTALIVISLLIAYQIWRFTHAPSAVLAILTAIDLMIVYFIWREWRSRRANA
ncbi:MAG: DUF2127 domain-containing protein [Lacunisphaera sp.]